MADGPMDGPARESFQRHLQRLQNLGFQPKGTLVSDVAQAFQRQI
ncbi:hypothetical protein ACVDG5_036140 [Mesorhizobium sp. ORM6]